MSSYLIKFKKSAVKELRNLPNKEIIRITKLIELLIDDPRPHGSKKLKGYTDLWRIRSGNYRIIYSIEDRVLIIEILQVVDRKDAY